MVKPRILEGLFSGVIACIASLWSSMHLRYKESFDPAKPLLHLSGNTSNSAHFVGTIVHIPEKIHSELACDFKQIQAADNGDLYISAVYPCRKTTQIIAEAGGGL
jgi:hypothetical protein